jgi:Kef-type K+ transport system membrane component KefB/Trk K+ transport system NAD-binding subunit
VLGLGGLQVAGTAAAITPVAMLLGLPWQQALALGLCVSMSSTAIALQTLTEKNLMRAPVGQTSFAVLLFQDLSVIPILALFPLLVTLEVAHPGGSEHGGGTLIDALPAWGRALAVLGAVTAVVAAGRLGVGPLMRVVARTGLREMFTATALLLVVGVALLMTSVGLSAALGTFVAGVVLANSEYRHELVSDVEPFKGLLLGLFFIAVGASIDFGLLLASPMRIGALVLAVVALKIAVLAVIGRLGGLTSRDKLIFAAGLSQIGEFAFVLFSLAASSGVLPTSVTGPMTAVTAFSMALTPVLFTVLERFVLPRMGEARIEREADAIDEHNPVIIAGYGRFGQIAGRLLRANKIGVTVLDVDSEQVDAMRKFGMKVFYGDASRQDLLHAAGAEQAKLLIVAVDDPDKALEIVHLAKRHHPHLAILARARGRTEAYDLIDAGGVDGIYRETFETAVRVGQDALRLLGIPAYAAHRMARTFRRHDERVMLELAEARKQGDQFVSTVRARVADFEQLLRTESEGPALPDDPGWDSEEIRTDLLEGQRQTPPPA